ncbi:MAG: OmpH family outer membrane protein [Balneolaceae bacterium]
MSNKLTAIVIFLSIFLIQNAFAQVKIGYTNPARILSELPEVEEVDKQIEALITEKDQELAQKATDLQQIFTDYETGMGNLSEDERSSREEELMQLNQQFEADRENMMNEIRERRNELMEPIIEKMNVAMEEVAEEMGLDLILNEGTSYGDAIIFYASGEELNITNKIIEKIK